MIWTRKGNEWTSDDLKIVREKDLIYGIQYTLYHKGNLIFKCESLKMLQQKATRLINGSKEVR